MESREIRLGARDADVVLLQKALLENKFNPGALDGEFGFGTQSALMAFQRSRGLVPDGIAGPRSLTLLGLLNDNALLDATTGMSVQVASQMCPGAPLHNIKANLPILTRSLLTHSLQDRPMVLMAIATIRAETASFSPISEGISRFNTSPSGQEFDLYDHRSDLGNTGAPDGKSFCGRGFIQLTGRFNYKKFGARLSPPIDLEANPGAANQAEVAADLLCLFLRDHEVMIKNALLDKDFRTARKLVNGGSHGIDSFTDAYQTGDRLMP